MKDDEFVAQLLLLIEEGPKSYSQDDLDTAFAQRDQNWEDKDTTTAHFQEIIDYIAHWGNSTIFKSRLRNQADFFSLFGAINEIINAERLLEIKNRVSELEDFMKTVDDRDMRSKRPLASDYYNATR